MDENTFKEMEDDVTQAVARSESQIENQDDNKSMVLTEEAINTDSLTNSDGETSQDDGETSQDDGETSQDDCETYTSLQIRLDEAVDKENMELVEELVTRMGVGDLFQETRRRCCCLALKKRNLPLAKLIFCTHLLYDSHYTLCQLIMSPIASDFVDGFDYVYSQCVSVGLEEIFLDTNLLVVCVKYNSLNVTRYILLLNKFNVSHHLFWETMSVDVEMLTLLLSNPSIKQTINDVGKNRDTAGGIQILKSSTESDCLTRVRILVKSGCDFDFMIKRDSHYNALVKIVKNEWFEVLFYLVENTNTSRFLQLILHILYLKFTQCGTRDNDNILPRVHTLLNSRFSIHDKDEYNNTPLLLAADCGLYDVVMFLLDQGASSHDVNYKERNLLHITLSQKIEGRVKILVARLQNSLRDLDKLDCDKKTPLSCLCQGSDDEDDEGSIRCQIAEMLLEAGCHVNHSNKEGETPLMLAVKSVTSIQSSTSSSTADDIINTAKTEGGTNIVQILIQHGADVNQADRRGDTALIWASEIGKIETVKCLIGLGADVSQTDDIGLTALMWASKKGKTETVKCLITLRADVNQAKPTGTTALILASREGKTETVKCLIELGADVNNADPDGSTALMKASMEGKTETVKCLIELGADVNQADTFGYTAFIQASWGGKTETIKCLIEHGADVKQAYASGNTALMWASTKSKSETVKCLIQRGADVNQADYDGDTALMWASREGKTETVKSLIELGADVNPGNRFGYTALMWASRWGNTETVKCLIKLGAGVNNADLVGDTALMKASKEGKTETVKCLIELGADVNQANTFGYTALIEASWWGKTETIKCLIEHGADVNQANTTGDTALMWASKMSKSETVKCLIELGADVNQYEYDGLTALMWASREGKTETVKCLIEHRADVNQGNTTGQTALMEASRSDYTETVKYLITLGADVNKTTSTGVTALMLASRWGNTETIKCLIELGADVNKTTSSGLTALMKASWWGNTETVLCLIEYCTDVNKADSEGKTALSQCCLYGINGYNESYIRMFKTLVVESGADFSSRYYGVKFVQLIIARHSIEIFRYLISLKPEIVDYTAQDETICHLLAKVNYEYTIDNFEWNFQYGVNINHLNSNSDTSLMIAALLLNEKYLEVCTQHPAIIINIQNNKGHTALHGCILGFTMIINKDYKYNGGEKMYSIYLRCVDILLDAHVDVNIQDHMGRTALMLAVRENDKILTRKLLDAGARTDLDDFSGYVALQYLDIYETNYDLTCFQLLLTSSGRNNLDLPCIHGDTFIQRALQFPCYWNTHNLASFVRLLVYYNCSLQKLKPQLGVGGSRYKVIGFDEFTSEERHQLRQLLYVRGAPEGEIASVLDFQVEDEADINVLEVQVEGEADINVLEVRVEDEADNNRNTSYSMNGRKFNKFCFGFSLKSKCRRVIRQHLGLAINENMKYLGIPRPLMEFLLLRDVLPATEDGILDNFVELRDDWHYCSYRDDNKRDDDCSQYEYESRPLLTYYEQKSETSKREAPMYYIGQRELIEELEKVRHLKELEELY